MMETAKEVMWKIIKDQPEDSTYDELLRELALRRVIERGLADVHAGRVIDHEEMKRRAESWPRENQCGGTP